MLSIAPPVAGRPPYLRRHACRRRRPTSSVLHDVSQPNLRSLAPELPPITAAKRVVLVRHGQSTWNEEGRIQGSSDFSVLTSKGKSQAETNRQMLIADSFDVCFTSPLARSKRTAEIIWAAREEEMIPEYDLREIDLYSFQGLLKHEGKEKFGDAYRQWQKDAANFVIDGHYPVRELWARAGGCWSKILAHKGRSVLVVAHNAVNQALVASAIGLGTEYFRILLQSNCGVTVLDFTPQPRGGPPHVCLNRLNQTPNSPITSKSDEGRKTNKKIILVCHGSTESNTEGSFPNMGFEPMNMLGVIQSQKIAELLLDMKLSCIVCSPRISSSDTAAAISEVQEAADCLGADHMPRSVELKKMLELEVEPLLQRTDKNLVDSSSVRPGWLDSFDEGVIADLWNQSKKAWASLLDELADESEPERNVVVVGHPAVHIAMICHCLNLPKEWMGSFHLDTGSVSVLDFPDGPAGSGVARCLNYTSHLGRWAIPVTRSPNDE